ncbi:MAG TPA: hypothetical protein DDW27_18835 [Bacteroidales bacterium]|nr:hypothetical protein [Bacteroidales bacterium]
MGLFLGLDLGTSYFKAGLFDEKGRLKGLGRQPVPKYTGDGTICELSVSVFWKTLRDCVEEAMQSAYTTPGDILALSYSSQANSFILLDNRDQHITPLILWPDKRAEKTNLPHWISQNKEEFINKTGFGIDPNYELSVSKIYWFQKERPEIWERVNRLLSISDYLTYELTGGSFSDTSTASLTGLLDVTAGQWWDKSLRSFNLSSDYLSLPLRTGIFAGVLTRSGAKLIGLKSGIPYFMGGLDHHCAAIGCGVPLTNSISESTGTVLACVSYSRAFSPQPYRFIAPGLSSGDFFQMAFNDNGAYSLEWYQKTFASEYSIAELLEMAKHINKGSEELVALPCAYKSQGLTGFRNITPAHNHGHFVRALLESTAASLACLIRSVRDPHFSGEVISTGGGAKSDLWIKIKADILKTVFLIPECNETACLGAAMIGAKGTGEFGDWNELTEKWIRFKEIVKPEE